MDTTVRDEVTELLQGLIRNECVNDGSPGSGNEIRSARLIESYFSGSGLVVEVIESRLNRGSVLARLEGRDPAAPTMLLLAHLDVVPARTEDWQRDPFGGDLVDGVIWGRGAIDMLGTTAAMATGIRRLAVGTTRPPGTVLFLATADEEAGGTYGIEWILRHRQSELNVDYVLTEWGGIPIDTATGPCLWINVGEKGTSWLRIGVKGQARHASRPFGSDNALVTCGEVLTRLAQLRPQAEMTDVWREYVEGMAFDVDTQRDLLDPLEIMNALSRLPPFMAQRAHAITHMTLAPTLIRGGTKVNVIPDRAEIDLDVRTLPGQTAADAVDLVRNALGDLASRVEVTVQREIEGSVSKSQTPLWSVVSEVANDLYGGMRCVPSISTGTSDARFFRQLGIPAYGFGLYSRRISIDDFGAMFHGVDERIDQESLELSARMWREVASRLSVSDVLPSTPETR
jgi:acetylornithine deacetylase/succinyl-diaminopimelate desuccinylase-like protein